MDVQTVVKVSAAAPAAEAWREQAASRIAAELAARPDEARLAKVSSLLHAFHHAGAHADFHEVKRSLHAQGIVVHDCPQSVSRRDVLELGLGPGAEATGVTDDVRVSTWRPGEAGRSEVGLSRIEAGATEPGTVRWFDVVPPRDKQPDEELGAYLKEVDAYAEELLGRLAPWCSGVDEAMLVDLVLPDVQPKVETYGDERTGIRSVSLPAMVTVEIPDPDDGFDGVDERLVCQTVEMVVGPDWILTCWHRSRTLLGSGKIQMGPPLLREPFLSHVAHRWVHDTPTSTEPGPKTPSHLGLYLARSLAATYGASLRRLQRWVSTWEVEFYNTLGDSENAPLLEEAAIEISDFLAMAGEFSRSVRAFLLAGEEMPNKSWFPSPPHGHGPDELLDRHAASLSSTVDSAAKKLGQLADEIRADMDLLMIHSQARQQEASERLQGYLGKVTGLVLVPTFVAGLFGANTALPGGGTWAGFDIMLLLMVASGAISYFVIRRLLR